MYSIIPMVSSDTPEKSILTKDGKFAFVFDSEKEKNQAIDVMFQSLFVGVFVTQNIINNLHLSLSEVLYYIFEVEKEIEQGILISPDKRKENLIYHTEVLSNIFRFGDFSKAYLSHLDFDKEYMEEVIEKIRIETFPTINLVDQLQLNKINFKDYDLICSDNYNICQQYDIINNLYVRVRNPQRVFKPLLNHYFQELDNIKAYIFIDNNISSSPSFYFSLKELLDKDQVQIYDNSKNIVNKFLELSNEINVFFNDYYPENMYKTDLEILKRVVVSFIENLEHINH